MKLVASAFIIKNLVHFVDQLFGFSKLILTTLTRAREFIFHSFEVVVIDDALFVQCFTERAGFEFLVV